MEINCNPVPVVQGSNSLKSTNVLTENIQELPEHVNYWAKRWEEKRTGWHMDKVNPVLIENIDRLTAIETNGTSTNKSRKILVPLCGQTHDLLYLLSLGHQVFGIEGVVECITALAESDGFEFIFNPEDSIYHTKYGMLKIYVGDILECPIEKWGPFDCVWDRASLIAIEYPLRNAYVDVMKRSVEDTAAVSGCKCGK